MIKMLIIDLFILAMLAYGVMVFLRYREGEKEQNAELSHADADHIGRKQPAA